jgi:hypothetical protein
MECKCLREYEFCALTKIVMTPAPYASVRLSDAFAIRGQTQSAGRVPAPQAGSILVDRDRHEDRGLCGAAYLLRAQRYRRAVRTKPRTTPTRRSATPKYLPLTQPPSIRRASKGRSFFRRTSRRTRRQSAFPTTSTGRRFERAADYRTYSRRAGPFRSAQPRPPDFLDRPPCLLRPISPLRVSFSIRSLLHRASR